VTGQAEEDGGYRFVPTGSAFIGKRERPFFKLPGVDEDRMTAGELVTLLDGLRRWAGFHPDDGLAATTDELARRVERELEGAVAPYREAFERATAAAAERLKASGSGDLLADDKGRELAIGGGRIVYGARCTWWGSISEVGSTGTGLPVCPHCGGVLFEVPDEAGWWQGVDAYEAEGRAGYRRLIEWARGRCYPVLSDRGPVGVMADAFEAETGEVLSWAK
jgi:hypothetical protein